MKSKILILSFLICLSAVSYGQTKKKPVKKQVVPERIIKIEEPERLIPPPPPETVVEMPKSSPNNPYGLIISEVPHPIKIVLTGGERIGFYNVEELTGLDFKKFKSFKMDNSYAKVVGELRFGDLIEKLFNQAPNLEELSLLSSRIKNLPAITQVNSKLTALILTDNELETLPEGLEKFINLENLQIGTNKFTTLPKSVAKLKKLKSIQLGNNPFTVFPMELFSITSLESFSIFKCEIKALPDSFDKLPNLTSIGIQFTQIASLPPSFSNLSKLESLAINNNQFVAFPLIAANIKTLKTVQFGGNPIDKVPFIKSLEAVKWGGLLSLDDLDLTKKEQELIDAKLKLIDVYY